MIVGITIEFSPVCLSHTWYCHREGHVAIKIEDSSLGEIKLPITHHTPRYSFRADWVCIHDAVEYSLFSLIYYYLRCKVDDPGRKYPSEMLHKLYGHSATYVGW